MGVVTWTPEQEHYLREMWPDTSAVQIAACLGKTPDAVRSRAHVLGLRKALQRKRWTDAENDLVRAEYPTGCLVTLAERLGVRKTVLCQHAAAIGVGRDPEFLLEQNRALGKKLAASDSGRRFKKGQVSHNKGRKQSEFMSAEAIARTAATRFVKGSGPKNTKPIGYERISKDGYVEVKVRDTGRFENFEFKQRVVYEQHFGPIPGGMIVEFIDGDKRNFSPENLRLASRRENAARNIEKFHALPPEIKTNIKLIAKLKKTLK